MVLSLVIVSEYCDIPRREGEGERREGERMELYGQVSRRILIDLLVTV